MEVSALRHSGAVMHGRSPLLRVQSDERLIQLIRSGNNHAFDALVARYQSRLLAFCRHMLGSREDAEDVLQEVFAAAFNAMIADEREINVRPWLYRIARNRSLNHLRRTQAVGVDSMDIHLSEGGITTADKVHKREEFRLLISDVQDLPETQRTALLLREIDALSYEQIAEAMETTVPSVKSLLVRARVSLAEAAEARLLSCEEVRLELGEVAEGLTKTTAPVRRHLRTCERCQTFRKQLRATNKSLAALYPLGPLVLLKKSFLAQIGGATAAGGSAAGTVAGTGAATGAAASALQAGLGALGAKAAAGLAAAAIVTAGAVEVKHVTIDQVKPKAAPEMLASATPSPAPASIVRSERAPRPIASVAQPAVAAGEAQPRPKTPAEAREARKQEDAKEPAAAAPTPAPPRAATLDLAAVRTGSTPPAKVQQEQSTTSLATDDGTVHNGGAIGPEEGRPQTTTTTTTAAAPAPSGPTPAAQPQSQPEQKPASQPEPEPTATQSEPQPQPADSHQPAPGDRTAPQQDDREGQRDDESAPDRDGEDAPEAREPAPERDEPADEAEEPAPASE